MNNKLLYCLVTFVLVASGCHTATGVSREKVDAWRSSLAKQTEVAEHILDQLRDARGVAEEASRDAQMDSHEGECTPACEKVPEAIAATERASGLAVELAAVRAEVMPGFADNERALEGIKEDGQVELHHAKEAAERAKSAAVTCKCPALAKK